MKKPEVFRDETIAASTHKFGAETMQKPHPAINVNNNSLGVSSKF